MRNRLRALSFAAVAALLMTGVPLKAVPIVLNFATSGVGSVDPDTPANITQETIYSNALVTWYNGGANPNGGGQVYVLNATGPAAPLPVPVAADFTQDSSNTLITVNPGDAYIMGKYGTAGYLFYIGNLGGTQYQVPSTLGDHGLSHLATFTAPMTVPDGGATVALIGLALLGLAAIRRRFV